MRGIHQTCSEEIAASGAYSRGGLKRKVVDPIHESVKGRQVQVESEVVVEPVCHLREVEWVGECRLDYLP